VAFQHLAFVVDGAPQEVHLAVDLDVHLVEVPLPVAEARIRLTRWRRMSAANSGPKRFHHSRTVSWQRSTPRSNNRSSTLRNDSGKRRYIITTSRITSGDEWK